MLVCSPCVFQIERHCEEAKRFEWGDERCCELLGLFHRDLMVPRVRIKEAKGFHILRLSRLLGLCMAKEIDPLDTLC